ncbi:hypothetical protein RB195_014536 [Necator americanus]|uniref:Sulfotransferase family protein n=1 Tax=Necator americanus TaxID=51031 RepID=A0ABR1E292_NECAM
MGSVFRLLVRKPHRTCSLIFPKLIIEQIQNGTYETEPFNKSKLISPFVRYRETFQVAPKYGLSSCQIEKVMTTVSGAIFCYITNTSEFEANNRKISTEEYSTRFCQNENFYENFTEVQNLLGASKTEYVIVRNPISRFLSGFVNKCIREEAFRVHRPSMGTRNSRSPILYAARGSYPIEDIIMKVTTSSSVKGSA